MLKWKALADFSGNRIQFGFTSFLLVCLIYPVTGNTDPFLSNQLSTMKLSSRRGALLKYPPIPKQLIKKSWKATPRSRDKKIDMNWGLKNIGFFKVFSDTIRPVTASVRPCSRRVVVAVIDTGIDYTHPELRENLWVNRKETGKWTPPKGVKTSCRDKSCNQIDDDNNGFADDVVGWDFVHNAPLPFDTHGHGTHIAGIVASRGGNGIGISGVCSGVSIMALKYYDNSVLGYNNLQNTVKAIRYAIDNGANIINYSGGGSDSALPERIAIEKAQRSGLLFVAAAGNEGRNSDQIAYYPASYSLDNIVSVASINQYNHLLPSSNFGSRTVDIAAPGLGIYSTIPSMGFGRMSGTSQATAFVTGAAALLASQMRSGTKFHYKEIKKWLIKGSTPLASKRGPLGGGILSLPNSLALQSKSIRKNIVANKPAIAKAGKSTTKRTSKVSTQ